MHSTESRSSEHSDTKLEALPAKIVFLSVAKRLIRIYDENGDEMFALSDSEEGVSHSHSIDPDQSRTATLSEKLEGAIKKETECIPKAAETRRAIIGATG